VELQVPVLLLLRESVDLLAEVLLLPAPFVVVVVGLMID
jgi:hypothetical protein